MSVTRLPLRLCMYRWLWCITRSLLGPVCPQAVSGFDEGQGEANIDLTPKTTDTLHINLRQSVRIRYVASITSVCGEPVFGREPPFGEAFALLGLGLANGSQDEPD